MKRPRRWAVPSLLLISLVVGVAAAALWVRGTDWVRRGEAFKRTYPNNFEETLADVGIRSVGIYSHWGMVGIMVMESGVPGLEKEELEWRDPPDAGDVGWGWKRTGEVNDYMGGIPEEFYPDWVEWSVPHCVYVWEGEEGGMRHFLRVRSVMVSEPVLVVVAAAPWAIFGWVAVRRGRRKHGGRCVGCGYDLRATPGRCPECGMVVSGG